MTASCEHVRAALLSSAGDASLEAPDVASHLASCDACRELATDGGRLGRALGALAVDAGRTGAGVDAGPTTAELEQLFAGVQADVARERGPMAMLRSRSQTLRVVAVAALIVLEALLVVGLVPRSDLGIYPLLRHAAFVALLGGMALLAAWQSLRPLQAPALPSWVSRGVVIAGIALPFLLGMMPPEEDHHSLGHDGTGSALAKFAFYCLALGAAMGIAVIALLRATDRGGHGSGARATLAALAGGLAGTLVVHLHCPLNHPFHLLLGHAPVGLLLAASYALLRR